MRILIIDDAKNKNRWIHVILKEKEIEYDEVTTMNAAYSKIVNNPELYQGIILDMQFPQMEGYEPDGKMGEKLLKRLKNRKINIPILGNSTIEFPSATEYPILKGNTHGYYNPGVLNNFLKDYKEIGCKYVVVPYLTEECRPGTEGFSDTVKGIRKIGEAAKELGLQLLYHNHDFEFVKINGEYGLDVLYNTVPSDLLQTELDTCWVNVGGEVPAEYILKYTGRAPVVHLKDFVMKGKDKPQKLYELIGIEDDTESASEDDFSFKPVGYGVQDFPAILESAEKAGAKWVVVEQDLPDKGNTPLNAVKMSIDYLKKLGW